MFSRFVESAPVGLILCERDGRITLVNPRIEEEFGYRAEELLGRPIEVLLPERFWETHAANRESYAAADSRKLVWSLHPPELDRLGLLAALEHLVADMSEHGPARVELHAEGDTPRMSAEAEAVVYRIVQEALNNAQKHARAGSISVTLRRDAGTLTVVVQDDGRGFNPERTDGSGIGLTGMRERAELIGASFVVGSTLGAGTTIGLDVPLDA